MKLATAIVVAALTSAALPALAQQTITLDEATVKKLEELKKQEEQRKRMESQMRVTRSDWAEQAKPKTPQDNKSKCTLDAEQMRRLADAVDASRGEAGIAHIPQVIQQSRETDRQCQQQQNPTLRKEPEPKAMHPAKK